jgi:hypothetical protein
MKNFLRLGLLACSLLDPSLAQAATCYWVGGSGTWSTTNIVNWASGTGGTPSTCAATGGVPKQGTDIATVDGAATGLNGGTVTVDSSMNGASLGAILAGNMNGTLDFTVNNPSMTLTSVATPLSFTGTGTRTIKLGTGTFTETQPSIIIDLTVTGGMTGSNFSGATIVVQSTAGSGTQLFNGGGQSFGILTIAARSNGQAVLMSGANTFTTINLTGPLTFGFPAAVTTTVTNLNVSGTSSGYALIGDISTVNTQSTIAVTNPAISRAIFRNAVFTTSAVNSTNSIDAGNNNFNGGIVSNPTGIIGIIGGQ